MRRPRTGRVALMLTVVLSVVALFTLALVTRGDGAGGADSTARPKKVQPIPSATPLPPGTAAADQMPKGTFFLGTGRYRTRSSQVSDIARGTTGRLVRLSKKDGSAAFLIAYEPAVKTASLPVRAGWVADEVGRDGMWVPEACAQKPSWVISGRYLLINDARYEMNEVVDAYVVYDVAAGKFIYLTDPKAQAGKAPTKVLHVSVQGDNVVFYLDSRDPVGPHRSNFEYRHSLSHGNGFVVRRVISMRDFSFADYKVPFSTPPADNYTVQIHGQWPHLFLAVNDESRTPLALTALVPDQKLVLKKGWYTPPADPDGTAAVKAAERAVARTRGTAGSTTREVNVNIAGRSEHMIYLRVGSTSAPASLPAEFDSRRKAMTLPLGDTFKSAGFVVGVAT